MKNIIIPLLACLILMILSGCEGNDPEADNSIRIIGTGPVITKILSLDAFSQINNTGVADIYVTLGSPQSVVLKAQQNIIDVMTIGAESDELKIGLVDGVSIERAEEITFDITIPDISSVTLTGVGDYILSGDYREELTIIITGVGNVRAFDLKVGTCLISIAGVGDCEVFVMNQLIVNINGIGNVHWKGHPEISSSINGVGNLIDAN